MNLPLFRWMWRRNLPLLATWPAMLAAGLYVLLEPEPLRADSPPAMFFVMLHSAALAWLSGRFKSGTLAFLYTRGYTRDAIWSHLMLASAASVLAVWLPAALLVWAGARSLVQDRLLLSPIYPLMAPTEWAVPLVWLLAYGLALPAFHYAWIRTAQPLQDWLSPTVMIAAVVMAPMGFCDIHRSAAPWVQWLAVAASVAAGAALAVAARRLHRQLEVRV